MYYFKEKNIKNSIIKDEINVNDENTIILNLENTLKNKNSIKCGSKINHAKNNSMVVLC